MEHFKWLLPLGSSHLQTFLLPSQDGMGSFAILTYLIKSQKQRNHYYSDMTEAQKQLSPLNTD